MYIQKRKIIELPKRKKIYIVCTYKREKSSNCQREKKFISPRIKTQKLPKRKKIYITKDKNSEILQNTKDKIHELNTPDK
ncbi:hypothetical protein DWY47_17105 [Ruminococcus sp. AF25-23LB]|nr:hypothetical protein DWY47_17105 [Ruminococcus sp. AF25-23LB]